MLKLNELYLMDCMEGMKMLDSESIDLTLTDIPYGKVNRQSGGLRVLDKDAADTINFDLVEFLNEIYRITKSTIIIFCGKEQVSLIHSFFNDKQGQQKGTVRQLVWEKTNPSPMNGEYIYLSGIENAIWFKKSGGTFNARCKNTIFRYPNGTSKLHPTEKNHNLLLELILDNSDKDDIVFDPCAGSGSSLLVAYNADRRFIGFEIDPDYHRMATERMNDFKSQVRFDLGG